MKIIYKDPYIAKLDAEQKDNHKNLPDSDIAIGYHNGLSMAKAIAINLAQEEPAQTPTAHWEFGEIDVFGAEYVRCTRCGWKTDHVDPFLWKTHPSHKFCGNCGARMENNQTVNNEREGE